MQQSQSQTKQSAAAAAEPASSDQPPRPQLPKRKFRERAVPSSRVSRAFGFAGMGAGLAWGAASDAVSGVLSGGGSNGNGGGRQVLSEANARRLANGLCRMRGAALKIGQMMSIQDEDMLPPQVAAALEQVRQSADVMPRRQLETALREELGDDWEARVAHFDWEPTAAASIGQVHKARLHDGRDVAMKIQYPGVRFAWHTHWRMLFHFVWAGRRVCEGQCSFVCSACVAQQGLFTGWFSN